jgi:hypothetical protein
MLNTLRTNISAIIGVKGAPVIDGLWWPLDAEDYVDDEDEQFDRKIERLLPVQRRLA